MLLIYVGIEWQHENNLFKNIGRMSVTNVGTTLDTAVVQSAMISIHQVMTSRHALFKDQIELSWKQDLLPSADIDLMYGAGACGGYSMVLARTLQLLGYQVRIGQLKTLNYGYGGHIVIEYYSTVLKHWVMIDPLFLWIPKDKKGEMASIKQVANHWEKFSTTMPKELEASYRFNDVRYTNWARWRGAPKIIYHAVRLIKGTDYADGICLRMYVLSIFPWLFYGIMSTYLLIVTWAMVKFRKSSVFKDLKGNQAVKDEQ